MHTYAEISHTYPNIRQVEWQQQPHRIPQIHAHHTYYTPPRPLCLRCICFHSSFADFRSILRSSLRCSLVWKTDAIQVPGAEHILLITRPRNGATMSEDEAVSKSLDVADFRVLSKMFAESIVWGYVAIGLIYWNPEENKDWTHRDVGIPNLVGFKHGLFYF